MPDTIDPRIAMGFNPSPIGPNIGNSIAAAGQLLQFKQQQDQVQRQNALRGILGTPGAIDATGQPTPDTLTKVMGVDPNAGLQLQQNALVTQQRKLQMDALTTKTAFDTASNLNDAYAPILEQYKTNIEKGVPADAAMHEAQEATASTTDRLRTGGGLPPNVAQQLPTKFDPAEFERRAMQSSSYMDWWKQQQGEKHNAEANRRLDQAGWTVETDPTHVDASGKAKQFRYNAGTGQATELDGRTPYTPGGAVKAGAMAQQYSSPTSVQYKGDDGKLITIEAQQEKQTGQWVTADQNRTPLPAGVTPMKPLIPGSQAATRAAIADDINSDPEFKDAPPGKKAEELETRLKIAQGTMSSPEARHDLAQSIAGYQLPPLSGFALARPEGQKIQSEITKINPDYQATEYNNYNKTISGFGAGKQGDTIRYINNAIQHIDVMQKAAEALGSGDMRGFNTIANALGKEFGVAAPTTFDGLRQIVGTEIERAATGGVGAAVDRDRLIESLDKANSPEQLADVFKNFKALFGGQAQSLKTQYESGTPDRPAFRGDGPFSFDKKLLPQTQQELPGFDKPRTATAGQTGASGLTAGARATPEQLRTLPKPTTKDEAMKLGPGAQFVRPDGTIGIVPRAASGVAQPATTAAPAPTPAPTSSAPAASAATPGPAAAPLPLTKGMKPADLVTGKVYNTRYGPATWDGQQFVAQ